MPVESPEEFELKALEGFLSAVESNGYPKTKRCLALAAVFGIILLVILYMLHGTELLAQPWLYFISGIGGGLLFTSALYNYSLRQSEFLLKFVDAEAIRERVRELKM